MQQCCTAYRSGIGYFAVVFHKSAKGLRNMPIIYVLEADAVARAGLEHLLRSVGLAVWAADNVEAFLRVYQAQQPACLLLDLHIPDLIMDRVKDDFSKQQIDLPVIIMACDSDVSTAVAAMKHGAVDFLEKPVNEQLLLDSVHNALAKDHMRCKARARQQALLERLATLTARERDIFQRVAEGLSNREIAEQLALSPKTVELHRAKVMQKMAACTLSELIGMAMTLQLLKPYQIDF